MTIDERVRELVLVLPEPFRSPTGAAYPSRGCAGEAIEQGGGSSTAGRSRHVGKSSAGAGRAGANQSVLRVLGMVNISPGTAQVAAVVNGFSELILTGSERTEGLIRGLL